MRVTHLITGLSVGGAETMLWKLLQATVGLVDAHVLSLTSDGPMSARIRDLGVPVTALGMGRGVPNPAVLLRCARELRRTEADVLQTWMYHSDLVGGLAAKAAGGVPVAWGIHNLSLSPSTSKRSTMWVRKACALLSNHLPRAIVSCSQAAADHHISLGYARTRMRVIPNGFDLRRYVPRPNGRSEMLSTLGLPATARVVGLAARFDPMKDHLTFLRAASRISSRFPNAVFLLCGEGVTSDNRQIEAWVRELRLTNHVRLVGRRDDLDRLMPGWDVAVLSSLSEAFPSVLGEAMACGVPCVATDVGDSALIVGDTGFVVPAGDAEALASGIAQVLALAGPDRASLGRRARARVESRFSMESSAAQYMALYGELATGRGSRPR